MTLSIEPPRRSRKPDLTPMIDVVFLLLVFFMLASRFTQDTAIPLNTATGTSGAWTGPLRLVDIGADGALSLNGAPITAQALPEALSKLAKTQDDPVILRGKGAELQDLVTLMTSLRAAGFTSVMLVE
ncbi:biopolymer transporter ExbD [Thioclava sp. BHET1]|nr:biopolymer transporter ExbD [Thioclava sp. BHET1]